jgi:hypothetical protein
LGGSKLTERDVDRIEQASYSLEEFLEPCQTTSLRVYRSCVAD